MRFGYIFFTLGLFLAAPDVFAVDYDFNAAKARWDQLQNEANRAQTQVDTERRRLAPVQQEYDNAVQEVNQLTTQLGNIRTSLRQTRDNLASTRTNLRTLTSRKDSIEDDIDDLEREITGLEQSEHGLAHAIQESEADLTRLERLIRDLQNQGSGPWTCNFVDRGTEEHRGGHPATADDKSAASSQAETACLAVHGSCELASCTQPDSPELEALLRERDALNHTITEQRNQLQNIQNQLTSKRNSKRSLESDLDRVKRDITSTESSIDNYERDVRSLENDEQSVELSLTRARDHMADARSRRDRIQLDVDRAEHDYQLAVGRADDARRYYEQVLDNYNRAMTAAVNQGDVAARQHSGHEAAERSEAAGRSDGAQSAVVRGKDVGLLEARQISDAQGYTYGRNSGSSDGSLATQWNAGVQQGSSLARQKAQAENFPAGYNDTLNQRLAAPPSAAVTYDISDLVPQEPGDGGPVLDPRIKPIGNVRNPAFTMKVEPPFVAPEPQVPSINAPAPDRRYYAPDCSGQPLPVFTEACRNAYERSYVGEFSPLYRREYGRVFTTVFRQDVPVHYRAARQTGMPAVYRAASEEGTTHAGILSGFASALPGAQNQEYANGQRAFDQYLAAGILPVLRSIAISEAYPDDNLSPGERFKVKIVIDNYGMKSSTLEKLRLRISEHTGATLSLVIRKLPSLPADTTVTLEGVLPGQALADVGNLVLTGVLELLDDQGQATELDQASFRTGIRLPLEITGITFPGPLPIAQDGAAILTVKNNTSLRIESINLNLAASPSVVTFNNPQIPLGAIEPGAVTTLPVTLKATARAGGNQLVSFQVNTGAVAGTSGLQFQKQIQVPIRRNGNLDLCLPSCTQPYSLPLKVRAGGVLSLPAQFTFLSTRREVGPFVLGKLAVSDTRITGANGSTLRADLGSWGPGNSIYKVNFLYTIPTALRGQQHWVSLYLKEGANNIHVVEVPFLVE